MSSWREFGGRDTGPDGYRFGDLSRGVWGWLAGPPDDAQLLRDTRRQEKRREVQRRRAEQLPLAQRRFGELLDFMLAGGRVSEQQLNMLWEASRELSAEQAGAVIASRLHGSNSGVTAVEDEADKALFALVADAVLSGSAVSPEQLQSVSNIASRLSAATLLNIIVAKLTGQWTKREEAKQAQQRELQSLETLFDDSIRRLSGGAVVDKDSLELLLQGSKLLRQDSIKQIMEKYSTSWDDLWRRATLSVRARTEVQTEALPEASPQLQRAVSEANERKPGDPGWRPPPPPPRNRPAAAVAPADNIPAPPTEVKPEEKAAPQAPVRRPSAALLADIVGGAVALKPASTSVVLQSTVPQTMLSFVGQVETARLAILRRREFIEPDEEDDW